MASAVERLFSKGRADRILTAAAILLPLILPLVSYFGSNGYFASKRFAHIERKKDELNQEIARIFNVKVAGVSGQSVDPRITGADPSKTTLVEAYQTTVSLAEGDELRNLRKSTIAALTRGTSVIRETYRLDSLARTTDPGVFFFSETGLKAHGRGAGDLDWQLQLRFPAINGRLRLEYEVTVLDDSGKSLEDAIRGTIAGGRRASTLQVSGTIKQPGRPWKLGDSAIIKLELLDGNSRSDWWNSGRLRAGTTSWQTTRIEKLNAQLVKDKGFQYPTGVRLQPSDAFRISATGTIQPWSDGVCKLLGKPNATKVGPAGVDVNPNNARDMLGVSANSNHKSGCLLMRIGPRKGNPKTDWDSPINDRLYRARVGESGILHLSINSVEKRQGAFAGNNYWMAGGGFEISIAKLLAKFPSGTTSAIERRVKPGLE